MARGAWAVEEGTALLGDPASTLRLVDHGSLSNSPNNSRFLTRGANPDRQDLVAFLAKAGKEVPEASFAVHAPPGAMARRDQPELPWVQATRATHEELMAKSRLFTTSRSQICSVRNVSSSKSREGREMQLGCKTPVYSSSASESDMFRRDSA